MEVEASRGDRRGKTDQQGREGVRERVGKTCESVSG